MGRQSRPTLCNRLVSDSEPAGKDNINSDLEEVK